MSLEDRRTDLIGGGYDLAVRIGKLEDSSLVARRIAPVRSVLLASPDYLHARGRPAHPRDLASHDLLIYANAVSQWRFQVDGAWEHVRGHVRLRADNGDMLREAVARGTPTGLKALVGTRGGRGATLEDVFMTYTGRSLDDDVEDEEADD